MTDIRVLHGNCLDILPTLPDCSVDSIVTDPPYLLGFMGKSWDSADGVAGKPEVWAECLRVLKPGGHLLAFGGTRTYHRMAVAIEDAGFEIRDSLHWIYGSGFPKSLDVSKAIDKTNGEPDRLVKFVKWMKTTGLRAKQINDIICKADVGSHYLRLDQPAIPTAKLWALLRPHIAEVPGWVDELVARIEAEREVIGQREVPVGHSFAGPTYGGDSSNKEVSITAPATDAARTWNGWGTALKPAHEPILVARKPLSGTVAGNVLQWGTGAININGTRVGYASEADRRANDVASPGLRDSRSGFGGGFRASTDPAGRWPANIVFTHNHDCRQTGVREDSYQINRLEDWSRFGELKRPDYEGVKQTTSVAVWDCTVGCPVRELDTQSGWKKDQVAVRRNVKGKETSGFIGKQPDAEDMGYGGSGGASRFFTVTEWDAPFRYVAKPSKRERNAGLDHLPETLGGSLEGGNDKRKGDKPQLTPRANHHPTVKPLALMRWLVRLVTPPGGTVLEPFAGSGTTLVACHMENFNAIGIEMTDEYLPIIEGRLAWAREQTAQESPEQELPL